MSWLITLSLFFLISCASQQKVERAPASIAPVKALEIDYRKSLAQIFPGDAGATVAAYLYVQLRDVEGNYVDADPEGFRIQGKKGENISFGLERMLTGRYYLLIDKTEGIKSSEIDLYLDERPLKQQVKLHLARPYRSTSGLKVMENANNRLTLRLELRDEKGRPVELPEAPEILHDDVTQLESIEHLGEGVWKVVMLYPQDNCILYFSVRAMGTVLPNLLRHQHIEN